MAVKSNTPMTSTGHNGGDVALAESIAAATRSLHAKLNKSIIARLPMALPPRAPDRSIYACGLLHIAPIYITFEALWKNIVDAPPPVKPEPTTSTVPDYPSSDATVHTTSNESQGPSVRVHNMLRKLHLPGLLRSERLKADIAALTGWPPHAVEEQLRASAQAGPLAEFIAHIKDSIEKRPHVLIAYTYIMFMALFAGGRFIRASLESAGQDFWQLAPNSRGAKVPNSDTDTLNDKDHSYDAQQLPFCFLHFNTPVDGEDLKREFKQTLLDLEDGITAEEKEDMVHESIAIFEQISAIVGQLDDICGEMTHHSPEPEKSSPTLSDLLQSTLPTRLRDSVAVTRERRVRNRSSKKSSSDDDSAGTVIRRRGEDRSVSSLSSHRSDGTGHDHPTIPATSGIELCPAMASRSVRFDGPGPQKPQRRFSLTWTNFTTGASHYLMVTLATAVFIAAYLAVRSRIGAASEIISSQ